MTKEKGHTDGPSLAPPSARAGAAGTLALIVLLALCAGLTLLVFYPGYITVDARYVYEEAKAGQFGDWQSPAMGLLWRLIDPLAPGSLSMFGLTVVLYWLGFGVLAFMALRRSMLLGLATPVLALLPPAFFFVGLIWRDVLFGVIWLLAGVLAFAAAEWRAALRLPVQAVALGLVGFGVLLRPNAAIAAPFLAIYAIWPRRFDLQRAAIAFLPMAVLFVTLVPAVYYGVLDAHRQNPLHSIFVFDLGGITHFAGENQFPVTWSAQETERLLHGCYNPVWWDSYWHVPPCPFVMARLERPDDVIFGTSRLVGAWWHAVTSHPLAYLEHRATFMWQFLARSNLVLPVWDWEKPSSTYGHNPYFQSVLKLHELLQPSLSFRPGLWLMLALAIAAWSWPCRRTPAGAFAISVGSSAVVYVTCFFVLGVATDFRYAYWCVLAVLAGGVAGMMARSSRLDLARMSEATSGISCRSRISPARAPPSSGRRFQSLSASAPRRWSSLCPARNALAAR
jgi:hypothetical protein